MAPCPGCPHPGGSGPSGQAWPQPPGLLPQRHPAVGPDGDCGPDGGLPSVTSGTSLPRQHGCRPHGPIEPTPLARRFAKGRAGWAVLAAGEDGPGEHPAGRGAARGTDQPCGGAERASRGEGWRGHPQGEGSQALRVSPSDTGAGLSVPPGLLPAQRGAPCVNTLNWPQRGQTPQRGDSRLGHELSPVGVTVPSGGPHPGLSAAILS